jgi:superkiller protein 3
MITLDLVAMIFKLYKIFVLLIFCFIASCSFAQNNALKYFEEGKLYGKSAQYEEAIRYFDLSIQEDSNFYKAYRGKGLALYRQGRYQEALACFNQVLTIFPNNKAYIHKGIVLGKLGDYLGAIKLYDKAIQINNKDYLAYLNKAYSLINLRRYDEALKICNQGIAIIQANSILYDAKGAAILYNTRGAALGRLNRYEETIENYNKAIELKPDYYEPHKNKFCALYNLKRYREALETCDKAIALEPNRHNIYEVHTNRAMALNRLERYQEALEAAETVLKIMPDYKMAINAKKYAVQELNKKGDPTDY